LNSQHNGFLTFRVLLLLFHPYDVDGDSVYDDACDDDNDYNDSDDEGGDNDADGNYTLLQQHKSSPLTEISQKWQKMTVTLL
jgi:hypothetical protein